MIVRLAIASAILITDRANSHLRLSPLLDDLVFATSLILRAGKAHRKSVVWVEGWWMRDRSIPKSQVKQQRKLRTAKHGSKVSW